MRIIGMRKSQHTKVSDIPYGKLCTVPKYNNNMLCMRLQSEQVHVSIVAPHRSKSKLLDISTGKIYLIDPWEPALPVDAEIHII
jgi:hypothetical protein